MSLSARRLSSSILVNDATSPSSPFVKRALPRRSDAGTFSPSIYNAAYLGNLDVKAMSKYKPHDEKKNFQNSGILYKVFANNYQPRTQALSVGEKFPAYEGS